MGSGGVFGSSCKINHCCNKWKDGKQASSGGVGDNSSGSADVSNRSINCSRLECIRCTFIFKGHLVTVWRMLE